jgi:hypothetical protein
MYREIISLIWKLRGKSPICNYSTPEFGREKTHCAFYSSIFPIYFKNSFVHIEGRIVE